MLKIDVSLLPLFIVFHLCYLRLLRYRYPGEVKYDQKATEGQHSARRTARRYL